MIMAGVSLQQSAGLCLLGIYKVSDTSELGIEGFSKYGLKEEERRNRVGESLWICSADNHCGLK